MIGAFMNSLKYGFESHNFYGWHHATDADFTGDLTYNDITGKYYTSYGDVVNGEAVRIGLSFDARIIPRIETFGYEGVLLTLSLFRVFGEIWAIIPA